MVFWDLFVQCLVMAFISVPESLKEQAVFFVDLEFISIKSPVQSLEYWEGVGVG